MDVIIYSGGMDSFTLLHHLLASNGPARLTALSFDYGQRHSKELDYARAETKRLGIRHEVVDLTGINKLLQGSALTTPSISVPEGHYAEESMKKTVVPGRNTIMLSIAMALAESSMMGDAEDERAELYGPATVYFGAHAGDHAIYPDCRPMYVDAMAKMASLATNGKVDVHAPFLGMDKEDILRFGAGAGLTAADYARSWTCYKGLEHPCGVCGSCVERAEAFQRMGWIDHAYPV